MDYVFVKDSEGYVFKALRGYQKRNGLMKQQKAWRASEPFLLTYSRISAMLYITRRRDND